MVGNEIMVVMCDENHVGGDFIVPGKLPENLITESSQ
jgi:hypothetical protein